MHNERVHPVVRSVSSLVVVTTAAALMLSGCSSDPGSKKAAAPVSTSVSPSASSTVSVPVGRKLTDQGTKLSFGTPANVIFESTGGKGTVLQLTVQSVRQGTLADFKGFILDDSYKRRGSYYYARVRVRNVGEGHIGGVGVPVWGVNASNTLLPPVTFTTRFARCPSTPLPARFGPGAAISTCLVFLSPRRGRLVALSYRPSQQFNPITWTGTIAKPATPEKAAKKPTKKKAPKG